MKNFPHQHNQISRLRATLQAIRDLKESGLDPGDDGVLGDELARRQIHRFRSFQYKDDTDLEQRLQHKIDEERQKPSSSQGARTAARENRKTLRHLAWLEQDGTELTTAGEALIGSEPETAEELAIIQPAVAHIQVTDSDGNSSHPILHLLRLVDDVTFLSTHGYDGMELALEATDDSEEEYQRIEALARVPQAERHQQLITAGATTSKIANAKKVLPAFALSAKLMFVQGNGRYTLTAAGQQALKRGPTPTAANHMDTTGRRSARPNTVIQTRDAAKLGGASVTSPALRRALSGSEQQAAAELLYERTKRHQELVRTTAKHCGNRQFFENATSFDLVIDSGDGFPLDLIEVKTISGDDHRQIRTALGQLLDYEHFVVSPMFPDRRIVKSVVVDQNVGQELAEFLDIHSIGLLVVTHDVVVPQNANGQETASRLLSLHQSGTC